MVGAYKKKYKYILGIQSYANHDTGACIIRFSENSKKKLKYVISIGGTRELQNSSSLVLAQ